MSGPIMQLRMPNQSALYMHIKENAIYSTRMVQPNQCKGKSLAICGAGPSLREAKIQKADHVWACNSALPYLMDKGVRVTHGFAIDQGEEMLAAHEWARTFDVHYLLATSVHPKLTRHLLTQNRKATWFHNFLGIPEPEGWEPVSREQTYEMWLYTTIFPTSVRVGYGLNAVPRALCLAIVMGYSKIWVYGADSACAPNQAAMPILFTPEYAAWMHTLPMYADGRSAATFGEDCVMAEAVIDGVRWHTRADMLISARHLVDLRNTYPDAHIEFMGDTLINAIKDKPAAFWEDMPALTGVGEVTGFGDAAAREEVAA